jgi:hypothetical protein
MAEFKFYTSFTAKNGRVVYRTDGVLVQDQGRIRSGHIVDIRNQLSAFYVTVDICAHDENTLDKKNTPVHRHEGAGFYHLSERGNPGINQNAKFFVCPQEGEAAAIALHAHMTDVWEAHHAYWESQQAAQPVHIPGTRPEAPAQPQAAPIETKAERKARERRERGE